MKYTVIIVCGLTILSSCIEEVYSPNGLSKLSNSEIIKKVKNKDYPIVDKVICRTEKGKEISMDSLQTNYRKEEWTADWYVDKDSVVKELVLRKATEEDKTLEREVQEAARYQAPIELVEIECEKKQEILQNVFDSDQGMRVNGGEMNQEIDRNNLVTVINLIEKCGMPTLKEVNDVQMSAIWFAFQHGDNVNRKKYLPLLEESFKNGDLKATHIAMMKDRILMMDGEPQVYGTQVTKNNNEWELYELVNPETVNKRRAEIGFMPIQEYLSKWNIEFNIEQAK